MIWGGNKLKNIFNDINKNEIGETWVVSSLNNDQSIVCNGPYHGFSLEKLYSNHAEIFGHFPSEVFPLLIKYIDAKSNLSIQVHPNDHYAKTHENALGKSECWLVLDCDDNTEIIIGHHFKSKVDFKQAILDRDILSGLNTFEIKKYDFFYIPSGTIHAIGSNSLIYEVQQNSNITYRVYDYDRVDAHGKTRDLHIEKSLDVCDIPMKRIQNRTLTLVDNKSEVLCDEKHFKITSLNVRCEVNFDCKGYFNIIGCLSGKGTINGYSIESGQHIIVPNQVDRKSVV